jgi:hypothetical protein
MYPLEGTAEAGQPLEGIEMVLRHGGQPQVLDAVVEGVTVNVINARPGRQVTVANHPDNAVIHILLAAVFD